MKDHEAQAALDRIREALDTPDLSNPFSRLVSIGCIVKSLEPLTEADIRQIKEVAGLTAPEGFKLVLGEVYPGDARFLSNGPALQAPESWAGGAVLMGRTTDGISKPKTSDTED